MATVSTHNLPTPGPSMELSDEAAAGELVVEAKPHAEGAADAPAPAQDVAGLGMSAGELAQLIGTFRDATTRLEDTHKALRAQVTRLEGELQQTKGQLKRARELAALGEMAAGIAHEVRNPLGSIKLYAQALEDDTREAMPQSSTTARKIINAVDGLNAVVCDVLSFSRETNLKPVSTSALELMEGAAMACRESLEGIAVVLPGDADDVLIDCDVHLLHQALVNIVRNAADAVRDEAEPCITLGIVPRRVLDEDGKSVPMIALSVQDNGPGIPDEVLQRMFNPFFTTRETGTGLGLAIVHRIMDAHEGRVNITTDTSQNTSVPRAAQDAPAAGTTVELRLPVRGEQGDASCAHFNHVPLEENDQGRASEPARTEAPL